ncbi:dihydrolipoyl dehydrogenase [Aquibacillus sp. 3ASR75-11]|uniref:Dihydrolipoyl dehydrogenase n=1 Tax=Terrihalobacillus insolitus TaxID=2950438 RepID=A0A9X4AME3_9BACI|nr:dihydrolipoyl dehydrogenase [Terrihalobacillus insolitus]MDC3414452.1 dihydrolipoyl dehydrogenase [Terrihalobacillus insolitus]MDC3425332.1 dihydrolipoyl dehydrogenase [Terrihalobacillus insolitus]
MTQDYDLVIIGGGTGGYVAAIRASQLGLKTAIVEHGLLGGTCLHRGCIPSKALLRSAEVFRQTKEADQFGITTADPKVDFLKVQERKQTIVNTLHQGVQGLMKKGKIDVFEGYGRILGPSIFSPTAGTVSVEMNNGEENEMLIPKNVLIATGSKPKSLPGLQIDGQYVVTSDEALLMEELPASILIVGGGVIGIEWASMLADFGVQVTIIEFMDRILPTEDKEVSKEMKRLLKKKGISIHTNAKLLPDTLTINNGVEVQVDQNGKSETYQADKMLVSVGRSPNSRSIGLDNTDIQTNEHGCIQTNDVYQTKESHIYAIGDVIGGLQLAHVASHEGVIAVEHIAGEDPVKMNEINVPTCIYSNPEAASIGLTEEQAIEQGYEIKTGKMSFKAIGKALVYGETDGFVKIIANKQTDDLLGIHMVGPHVTDLISEAGIAKVLDATPWEIGESIHPHPTLSEAIGEAALAVDEKQIHG